MRAIEKLTVKDGETHEMKDRRTARIVEVVGDDFRAEKIVLTDVKDPGPGEGTRRPSGRDGLSRRHDGPRARARSGSCQSTAQSRNAR